MIKSKDIRDALSDLVKIKAGLNLRVHFNHILQADEDYCWIQLKPSKRDEGGDYFQRTIRVDIEVVLKPDEFGEVKHTDLYDIVDALDEATHPVIKILDRYITIIDCVAHIFDEILHYEFLLDFTDYIAQLETEGDATEFMQELTLTLT